jgi:hypothetical protein
MAEYWELWQRDRERWAALVERVRAGVEPVFRALRTEFADTTLLPNRWDVPGVEIFVPPGHPSTDDGASRVVLVYAEARPVTSALAFGAAAWFDEQGSTPRDPWTRWWCHTAEIDETRWETPITEADDVRDRVEMNVAAAVRLALGWEWDYDRRRWLGERLVSERPVRYSSVEPGRRRS